MRTEALSDSESHQDIFQSPLTLVEAGRRETFHELESNPELFIRRRAIHTPDTERAKYSAGQFDRLRQLGVKVPNFQTVIGHDEQGMAEFIIADKVHGQPLDSLIASGDELPSEALNRTFKGLLGYLKENQDSGMPAVWDLASRQFVYGHTAADPEEDIYFLDIDPTFRKVGGETLGRMELMMLDLQPITPLDHESWDRLRELVIANETGRVGTDLGATIAWMDEHYPHSPDRQAA